MRCRKFIKSLIAACTCPKLLWQGIKGKNKCDTFVPPENEDNTLLLDLELPSGHVYFKEDKQATSICKRIEFAMDVAKICFRIGDTILVKSSKSKYKSYKVNKINFDISKMDEVPQLAKIEATITLDDKPVQLISCDPIKIFYL